MKKKWLALLLLFAPLAAAQTLKLDLNRIAYRAGDRLDLLATTAPGSPGAPVDVYIGFTVPGGATLYLTDRFDLVAAPTPVVSGIELPDLSGVVFSAELPDLAAGHYSAFGFLTRAGAGTGAKFSQSTVEFSFGTVSFDRFVTLGDSLTHGTMEGEFNLLTQPFGYAPLLAAAMKAPFPLPLMSLDGRRIDPSVLTPNLGVNGASTSDVLRTRSNATTAQQIDSDEDRVFFPRLGTQIELAEQLNPTFVLLWIGSNDVLSAVTSIGHLDASQLTPLSDVQRDYEEIAARLDATGARVAVANVPDVTSIAFVTDGTRYGLPAGTLVPTFLALLIDRGIVSPFILIDPGVSLSPSEVSLIRQHVDGINAIVADTAARHGFILIDIHARYEQIRQNGVQVGPYSLTSQIFGGLFSLDAVHPGYTGHALIANFMIDQLNAALGTVLPPVDVKAVADIDPSVDHDGDGFVSGLGFARELLIQLGLNPDDFLDPDDSNPNVR